MIEINITFNSIVVSVYLTPDVLTFDEYYALVTRRVVINIF